jgi:hypothetical protein
VGYVIGLCGLPVSTESTRIMTNDHRSQTIGLGLVSGVPSNGLLVNNSHSGVSQGHREPLVLTSTHTVHTHKYTLTVHTLMALQFHPYIPPKFRQFLDLSLGLLFIRTVIFQT